MLAQQKRARRTARWQVSSGLACDCLIWPLIWPGKVN
jgi:hypothetical protein